MNIKKLGDAELEIMEVLWDSSEPLTSGYILEKIRPTRKWALSTLMATLARHGGGIPCFGRNVIYPQTVRRLRQAAGCQSV